MTVPMTDVMNSSLDALPDLSNVTREPFLVPTHCALQNQTHSTHAVRIPQFYGSLRERSFGRLPFKQATRLLQAMGAECHQRM